MMRANRAHNALLLILSSLVACSAEPTPPAPDIPPCEVEIISGAPSGGAQTSLWDGEDALARLTLWERGPYPVWTTEPEGSCAAHPKIPADVHEDEAALYVAYPTREAPLKTGRAELAAGPWPVVVFTHANNDSVCAIFNRYGSLMQHWASWGFIAVSVDSTAQNCSPGTRQNIVDRSDYQLAAIEALARFHETPGHLLEGRVDLSRIVLAGHSRGGGASFVSAINSPREIAGVITLQGVDVTAFGFGEPPLPWPTLGITMSEDVDLNYPFVEPTEDELTGWYSWVTVYGGIHAWTADSVPEEPDDVPKIGRIQQQDLTEYFTTAFLARAVGLGDGSASPVFSPRDVDALLFRHDGARRVTEEISARGVSLRWRSPAPQLLLDDFEGPRSEQTSPEVNLTGGANASTGFEVDRETFTYRPGEESPSSAYYKARSRQLSASDEGVFTLALGAPQALGASARFQARVKGPDEGDAAALAIIFELEDGQALRAEAEGFIGPKGMTNRFVQLDLPMASVPGWTAGATIRAVKLELRGGALFVDDPRFVNP